MNGTIIQFTDITKMTEGVFFYVNHIRLVQISHLWINGILERGSTNRFITFFRLNVPNSLNFVKKLRKYDLGKFQIHYEDKQNYFVSKNVSVNV